MAAEITYVCKRTVVSTKPVEPGKRHRLSAVDRAMERSRVRIVYYYRTPARRGRETGEETKRLRESMSEMLTSFPMMTGRLVKRKEEEDDDDDDSSRWEVKCNDAGVRMVEARAKGSVEEWLKCVDREKELLLVHWEDMYRKIYYWSTFYVQVTEFEEGGIAIGLSCTHLLADPICATMVIKAWADTSLLGHEIPNYPPHLPLFNSDTPLPLNYNPYTHHYKSNDHPLLPHNTNYSTVSLLFTNPMVEACIEMAARPNENPMQTPSPFQALTGLFWTCISNLKGSKQGRLIDMSICLDMRNLLGLEQGFFGNCMLHNAVDDDHDFSGHDQISKAAKAVRRVMEKMDREGAMDFIKWLEGNNSGSSSSVLMCGHCDHLICTNLEDLDPYSAVFQEGSARAPARVSYHVEPVGVAGRVVILPGPPEEGPLSRVVMVTLPEDEAVKLCEDVVMLSFSPTILMGLNKK